MLFSHPLCIYAHVIPSVLASHRAYYNQSPLFVSGPPATIPAIPFFTKQLSTEEKKEKEKAQLSYALFGGQN